MSSDTDLILEMLRRQQAGLDKMNERMDDIAPRIGKMEVDIGILGSVDAQVREELKSFKTEIYPSVHDWKRMKAIGLGLAGLVALGGMSVGATAVWAGETLVQAVRHWLRIG